MGRFWEGVKKFCKGYASFCACFWFMVWAVGSLQAGRILGLDELGVLPPASEWMGILRSAFQ